MAWNPPKTCGQRRKKTTEIKRKQMPGEEGKVFAFHRKKSLFCTLLCFGNRFTSNPLCNFRSFLPLLNILCVHTISSQEKRNENGCLLAFEFITTGVALASSICLCARSTRTRRRDLVKFPPLPLLGQGLFPLLVRLLSLLKVHT